MITDTIDTIKFTQLTRTCTYKGCLDTLKFNSSDEFYTITCKQSNSCIPRKCGIGYCTRTKVTGNVLNLIMLINIMRKHFKECI